MLVSGRGSNLQAILDAIERGELSAVVSLVVSNHRDVPAIERAERHGVAAITIERASYASRGAHHAAIADALVARGVQLVVLAGFDRLLEVEFVRRFAGRIINIHPSLLPSFGGGLQAQADALAHGVKVTGCTVHFVTAEVDGGPIILQRPVAVRDEDTVETLAGRILVEEHRALPEAIRLFAEGRVVVEGRRVRLG